MFKLLWRVKMKTKTNKPAPGFWAFSLGALLFCGSNAMAQSDLEEYDQAEVNIAFARLEVMMEVFENDIRYVAPDGFEEDVKVVLERLEIQAAHLESEIMYAVPWEQNPVYANEPDDNKERVQAFFTRRNNKTGM